MKVGGEFAFTTQDLDSRAFEHGVFQFTTDAPFNADDPATWPTLFSQQKPSTRDLSLKGAGEHSFRTTGESAAGCTSTRASATTSISTFA